MKLRAKPELVKGTKGLRGEGKTSNPEVASASHLRRSIDHVTQIDRLERSGAID